MNVSRFVANKTGVNETGSAERPPARLIGLVTALWLASPRFGTLEMLTPEEPKIREAGHAIYLERPPMPPPARYASTA